VGMSVQKFKHVAGNVLKHQVQLPTPSKRLNQVDNVRMLQLPQHLQFTDGCASYGFVFFRLFKLFNGNKFLRFFVFTFQHHSVCTFADNVNHLVFVHGVLCSSRSQCVYHQ